MPSQVIQQVAKRIHLGYDKFFGYLKAKKKGLSPRKVGKPKIKPRHKYNSLTFTQAGYEIIDNRIHIKCLDKSFTFWKHRKWTGTIKTITIKRDNVGDYYLYLSCEDSETSEKLPLTSHEAGADFGMKPKPTPLDSGWYHLENIINFRIGQLICWFRIKSGSVRKPNLPAWGLRLRFSV